MRSHRKKVVFAECTDCDCSGVYQGFMEGKGEAVICMGCDGTGCRKILYAPFVKRRRRPGVKTVRNSAGRSIVTGCGPTGDAMSYEQFLGDLNRVFKP